MESPYHRLNQAAHKVLRLEGEMPSNWTRGFATYFSYDARDGPPAKTTVFASGETLSTPSWVQHRPTIAVSAAGVCVTRRSAMIFSTQLWLSRYQDTVSRSPA